jgi:plastocyanin
MTKRQVHLATVGIAAVIAAAVGGCGSSTASSTSTSNAPQSATKARVVSVAISGYAFHPANVVVAAGTRISFVNRDSTAHTAATTSAGFDSGTLKHGQSATETLTRRGTFAYICQFHAFMHGTVTVR